MHWINLVSSVAIVGRRDSGKTALSYEILSNSDKPIYVFNHPKPDKLPKGMKNLRDIEDIEYLENCIVWIDEPQLVMPVQDKKANDSMAKLLSIALHRGVCIILSTSDTRYITKGLESYIDVWLIKDIEIDLVKRGSLISKIARKYTLINPNAFKCKVNEYIYHSRLQPDMNGRHTYTLKSYMTRDLLKAFGNANSTAKPSPNSTAKIESVKPIYNVEYALKVV
jgi:hypothetical protein